MVFGCYAHCYVRFGLLVEFTAARRRLLRPGVLDLPLGDQSIPVVVISWRNPHAQAAKLVLRIGELCCYSDRGDCPGHRRVLQRRYGLAVDRRRFVNGASPQRRCAKSTNLHVATQPQDL